MKTTVIIVSLWIGLNLNSLAQQQLNHPKKSFVDSAGRCFQQAAEPVYLFIATSANGKGLPLSPLSRKEVKLEGHGVHSLKHENHETQEVDEFKIYADGQAPVTTSTFIQAPAFQKGEKQYYGHGLQVTLAAIDEMSGVDAIYHSINGIPFQMYSVPNFSKEGNYVYNFYTVDRTGNVEKIKTRPFIVDLTPPASYHNIVGISSDKVISTNSTIYITIGDSLSGVAKTFYKFDKENFKPYTSGNIAFQYLTDGDHTLTYYSVDNVANKENEKSFAFYLDKTAPIMSADVLGDKFIVGDRVYFSGRTKLKLTAIDNKSGIKEVLYTVNDQPETKYTEPFYLPNKSGIHNVRFHAVDNTNNPVKDDFQHSVGVIYVDLTGPTLSHSYNGATFVKADTVFISPQTTIAITGTDPEAGIKKMAYHFEDNDTEIPYNKPVAAPANGFHKLTYVGYDNVNNKNERNTFFVVDTQGPEIHTQFTVAPKDNKYPSYTNLYLSASDLEVGADQISYSINGGKVQPYTGPIKGFIKNKDYTINVTATDLLGNTTRSEIKFKTDRY